LINPKVSLMHLPQRSFLFALIALSLAFAVAWAGTASARAQYTLGSGDRLRVTVFGQEDLSGEFLVEGTGLVSLPLIGSVPLGGKSVTEAESAIIDALKPDYLKNPRVSVQVLNYRPFYIIGEVNRPGSYPYVSGMTVLEAVAIAGGFTYRAKEKEMNIVRGTNQGRKEEEAEPETLVLPGDVIEVPERFF
jgi:protein involved in polysaccharide export with SLBB domain